MRLLALGVDHRSAPASIREALAFEGGRRDEALELLRREYSGAEFVVLSTCNRVELYSAGEAAETPEFDELSGFLSRFHGVPDEAVSPHLVAHHDEAMIGHLFRVSSSLESLVLGEGQILGQVRDAYLAADARKSVGPILHTVFQGALRVGKRVREVTGMDRGKLSIASVAVDLAREVFDSFGDKTVLVIGAGKMADLTLQHLTALRPGRILVTNRSPERALAAAAKWGGRAVPFETLNQALIDADLVVSTTAAGRPIVGYEQFARAQRARRNRLALILDIAIPRDFDPKVGDLDQVLLYNVDDLQSQVERNQQVRRQGIEPALAIIEKETTACLAALRHQRHAGALLRELSENVNTIRARELDRLFRGCPELGEHEREAIAHMALRLQNQFLHHPRAALRAAAEPESAEHTHSLVNAVRHLFGLGPADGPRTEP